LESSTGAVAAGDGAIIAKQVVKTYDTGKVKVEALRGVDLQPG
jgi:hypothetical protein